MSETSPARWGERFQSDGHCSAVQLWAAESTRQQRRSKQTIIFITFGSRVWPLRKAEHLQLLFTSAAVVVKNTPLLSSLKHCGAINRALFLQFPSLWKLCNDWEGFLLTEALPSTHVRPCLHPSQPPTEVGQVCWEFCELCAGRVPRAAQSPHWYSSWGDHVWVITALLNWALGSGSWAHILRFFHMSQSL